MDKTDHNILAELQRNGRLSSQALAERVGLSTSPCWRRVRKMEQSGVIKAHVAIVDPAAVGLHVLAYAQVSLEDHHPDSVAEFDSVVTARPEILECHAMSGQHDYLLKVICESIGAYDRLLSEHILRIKAVHTVNTSFVLRTNKSTTALPLEL
ncbi:MAG: winged helix-turn-helix transcriptional regulator [Xanthomonadales bacterium]|nr:winged helix-turn-helix transcriptional regulator [Xanthomonadales bacterium]NIN58327.1 winged helix-turn-helix transcriptional regulator [Xanthomonadales bacterium]NIN73672.1 winged helix-turn-helix transcriptional regulator [Xanthomonadales bacterium]NIO14457.1 winged helix-turn-helix transcriptional regulator [Xanthomonadales bacterium]NIP10720.1 winged helix-turn-helix transcriptional regulator [Xanthomonadales bacterium]